MYNRKLDIIVTADMGEDSLLVVWDVSTGTPKKTIFNPHPEGVVALDVSNDGTMIGTLSKANTPQEQIVTLWKWEDEDPSYITSQMDEQVDCMQKFIKFDHNRSEFVTTGESRILFWSFDGMERTFTLYSP